jgi:hypothetical protein
MFVFRFRGFRLHVLAILISGLVATGCSTTTGQSFNVVTNPQGETGLIAVGADFSIYDRLNAEDMGIYFPSRRTSNEYGRYSAMPSCLNSGAMRSFRGEKAQQH